MIAAALHDLLRAVFAEQADIPQTEWIHFWSHVREKRFADREHLIHEGRKASTIHYVVSGLVRIYYNHEGREQVQGFDFEGRWVTAYESVLTGEPALYSVQALEPTQTLSFSGELLFALYARHPCWDRVGRRILESQWVRQSDKERRFRVHSPEEHYRVLIARRSPLIDRVPLNQLASFLQITPETLSRIRARIRSDSTT
ncbi:MAG: Crp/Fnr family transcriptional regulator [Gemmatimonadales bacterium]|nr:Crp/Fnr family transcriptional regulator [Gemmatimonadales bacterium]